MNEIYNILKKIAGQAFDKFDLTLDQSCPDGCRYQTLNGKVFLVGRDRNLICRGIFEYLRKYCGFNYTWTAQSINIPAILPDSPLTIIDSPFRYRLYMNMCTFGYSTVWWDWDRWEKEIDWMALHGINMPLAMCGQEAIWARLWQEFGISKKQLDTLFTGPAYLPWNRCGNITGFDSPLPDSWIEDQMLLQKKIIGKMVSLDMHPVVPAFSGNVPAQLSQLYPEEQISKSSSWAKFEDQYRSRLLSPRSPLFRKISEKFIKLYESEYGKQKYFLADVFHENSPSDISGDVERELSEYGASIYEGIKAGNSEGIWVLQGWAFYFDDLFWTRQRVEALLRKIPAKEAIVIDLCNERFSGWEKFDCYGDKDWIYSFVHNFGGNDLLNGDLKFFASHTSKMLSKKVRPVGFGISPEGIENNEVVYELLTDLAWSKEEINVEQWLKNYCWNRYHINNQEIHRAWKLLLEGTYCTNNTNIKHGFQHRPSPQLVSCLNSSAQLRESASILVDNVESLTNCSHFVYDTIEVLGQYCGTVCDKSIQLAYNAFIDNEIKRGETIADQVFMLLYEVDDLMGVIPGRSVHAWSRNAETFGSDPQKKAYYRKNGLRLLSTWGGPILADYAARMWSGLIYSYYAARWQAYFSSVISKEDFDVEKWEHNWIENKCVHESKQFDVIKKIKKAFALVSKLDSWLGNENVISHSQKVGRWTCKGNTCARVDVSNMLTRTGRYLFKIEQDTGMAMPEVHRARLFANDSLVHDCERVKPNVYQINCLDRKPGLSYSVLVDFGNPDKRELYGDFWMSCLGSKDVIVRKKVSDLEFQK